MKKITKKIISIILVFVLAVTATNYASGTEVSQVVDDMAEENTIVVENEEPDSSTEVAYSESIDVEENEDGETTEEIIDEEIRSESVESTGGSVTENATSEDSTSLKNKKIAKADVTQIADVESPIYGKRAFEERNTNGVGNKFEAEEDLEFINLESINPENPSSVKPSIGEHDGGQSRHLKGIMHGSVARTDIYFDRKTSGITFRYASWGWAEGTVYIYIDNNPSTNKENYSAEIWMSNTSASDFDNYVELSADVEIPSGNHSVYFRFDNNMSAAFGVPGSVANIDYFQFTYTPEKVKVENEVNVNLENRLDYAPYSYLTNYVKAPERAKYQLTIGYITENGNATKLGYRVNGIENNDWSVLDVLGTANEIKTCTVEVELEKDVNLIDIAGVGTSGSVHINYYRLDPLFDKDTYWENRKSENYGIYPIDSSEYNYSYDREKINSNLVQSDVIGKGDTYEVVYEPGKDLYFYCNPYEIRLDATSGAHFQWSAGTEKAGADGYNPDYAQNMGQNETTVWYQLPEEGIDFLDKDYVTTEIGCQIVNSTNVVQRTITFTLKILKSPSIYIDDTIRENGRLEVKNPEDSASYIWQKSEDGITWSNVSEKRYDLQIVNDNGQSVNVARDYGGGMYYRVRKSGTDVWSLAYHVPYYNDVQNGDFEYPAMYGPNEEKKFKPLSVESMKAIDAENKENYDIVEDMDDGNGENVGTWFRVGGYEVYVGYWADTKGKAAVDSEHPDHIAVQQNSSNLGDAWGFQVRKMLEDLNPNMSYTMTINYYAVNYELDKEEGYYTVDGETQSPLILEESQTVTITKTPDSAGTIDFTLGLGWIGTSVVLDFYDPIITDSNGNVIYSGVETLTPIFPFNKNQGVLHQYPNGYPGMIWKTTGPGWTSSNGETAGHDIEIVNGRYIEEDPNAHGGWSRFFKMDYDQMYRSGTDHGYQFAELNAEDVGALYQDILTTPGSECYWDLDHAGRNGDESIYVAAMASKDAQKYTTKEWIDDIKRAAAGKNFANTGENDYSVATEVTFKGEGGEDVTVYLWKAESPKGKWKHHSGKYNVPEEVTNHLTRFFFISAAEKDQVEGNFLDNVSFEMKQSYTIEYYIEGVLQPELTVTGLVEPYTTISVDTYPSGIGSGYTLIDAKIGGNTTANADFESFYLDEPPVMTIAANHNYLKLYYEAETIAITKRVEGMSELPVDYTFTFSIQSTDGGRTYYSSTITGNLFSPIDKQNDSDPDSCFVTISCKTSNFNLNEGENFESGNYIITETVSDPSVKIDNEVKYYLEQVAVNGISQMVPLSDLDGKAKSYSGNFTYNSEGSNAVRVVNTYKPTHKVSVTKKVTGRYTDEELKEEFLFTLDITKEGSDGNSNPVDAVQILKNNVDSHPTLGSYTFSLHDDESIEVMLYDECTVTVTEVRNEEENNKNEDELTLDYITSWSYKVMDEFGNTISVPSSQSVLIEKISTDIEAICTNDFDFGDVEVQGFQMNTNKGPGGASEINPSFRVVCRVSNSTINRKKVRSSGVIYALSDALLDKSYEEMKEIMVHDPSEEYAEYVKSHDTTEEYGYYNQWTTQDEFSEKYWRYYALTLIGTEYMYSWLEKNLTFRAYAILEDDSIVYGDNIFTVNMYDIADNLYKNQKLSTKEAHEFLYTNVLNVVTINKNRLNICTEMLRKLQPQSSTDQKYIWPNRTYKDMLSYVYCEDGYTYEERVEFDPIYIDENEKEEFLTLLNASTNTKWDSIFDWIYNEVVNDGFYRKVPYAWDNGMHKKGNNR